MNFWKHLVWCAGIVCCLTLMPVHTVHADELEQLLAMQQSADTSSRSSSGRSDADQLIASAMGLLGLAYRFGGTSPATGMDCSGFMQYVFRKGLQVSLPRTAAEQARVGVEVSRSNLQPGDMVFFNTSGRRISHVGMYIGNNRFIHAPRTGKNIEITSMENSYWSKRFITARRVKN